jgi:hypothetical protein
MCILVGMCRWLLGCKQQEKTEAVEVGGWFVGLLELESFWVLGLDGLYLSVV